MKNILLVAIAALIFAGCTGTSTTPPPAPTSVVASSTKTVNVYKTWTTAKLLQTRLDLYHKVELTYSAELSQDAIHTRSILRGQVTEIELELKNRGQSW